MNQVNNLSATTDGMRCDLCGGDDFSILSEIDRHGERLRTGLCLGCGLVMHLPVPSEEEVAEYYANRYRREYHDERVPSKRRVMRAWNNGERIHATLRPWLKGVHKVFEIGAGIGCTVKVFEVGGHQARGIEPNRDFNRWSREQLLTRIDNCNLYELDDAGSPDLMLLIHVIEHFSSPRHALKHIHGLLADGGLFYIECPNLSGPFATFGRMFHYAHIYNFTPATLAALAAECGFEKLAALSTDSDPDIRMLFRKANPQPAPGTLAGHPKEVLAAIRRHNTLSYHLRPDYLVRRVRKLWSYIVEGLRASSFVDELLARLQRTKRPSPGA